MSIQLASAGSAMESILFSFALLMRFISCNDEEEEEKTDKDEVDLFLEKFSYLFTKHVK